MTFAYVSGHAGLDLVGTLKWRRRVEPEEQLITPSALAAWAAGAGLSDDRLAVSELELDRARGVRESLYRAVTAQRASICIATADRQLLNATAAHDPIGLSIDTAVRVRRQVTVARLLTTVVRDTFELIAGETFARVRECEEPDCTRLFADSSRVGNRRWCGMAECGNRAKVQAFRERRAAALPSAAMLSKSVDR